MFPNKYTVEPQDNICYLRQILKQRVTRSFLHFYTNTNSLSPTMSDFLRRVFHLKDRSPTAVITGPLPSQMNAGPSPQAPTPTSHPISAKPTSQNPGPRSAAQASPAPSTLGSLTQQGSAVASRRGNIPTSSCQSQTHQERIFTNESIPPHSKQRRQTTLRSLDFRKEARRSRRNKKAEFVHLYSDYCLHWDTLRDWLSKRFEGYEFDEEANAVPVG